MLYRTYGDLSVSVGEDTYSRIDKLESKIRQQLGVPTGEDETVRELVGEYLLDRCRAVIRSTEVKSEQELYEIVTNPLI